MPEPALLFAQNQHALSPRHGRSLLFSVVFAVLAARYTPLRRVILPFVNFMESVPLVGFLTFTTVYFLNLYPHSVMGLECTAIFAVFTGQAGT